MIVLDAADLAVIAARTLGISTGDALAVMDIPIARAALAEAQHAERQPHAALCGRDAAAAAGVSVMHALLRYRPFPRQGRQVAVLAGLQFLSLNGWQADLNPPATAAVVIEALASGQLAADDAAAWLSQRLSPAWRAHRAPRTRRTGRAPTAARRPGSGLPRSLRTPTVKAVAGALATAMVGGVAILATACSRAPDMSPATPHHSAQTSQVAMPVHTAGWFAAAKRRGDGDMSARYPRRRRGLVPVRWYGGTFTLDGRRLRIPVARGCPPLTVRLDRDVSYPAGQVRFSPAGRRVRIFPSFAAAFAVAARSAPDRITTPLQSADMTSSDAGVHGSGTQAA